jgi:recombinational DNA repair ATPase RecF
MKLRRVEIESFRGSPRLLALSLKVDKSHFVFAENGRGKSTIPDALELLTTGDLVAFRREDCGLDAAINLHGNGRATVSAELRDPRATVSRALEGPKPSALEAGGAELELEPLPSLRQATIQAFMGQTAGEKREALLELLDLDALNEFRKTLRTGYGNAKERTRAARSAHEDEKSTLGRLLGDEALLAKASAYAKAAGLEGAIASEEDLEGLQLKLPPAGPNRPQAVAALARAVQHFPGEDPSEEWNAALAETDSRRAEALGALLERGARVLREDWPAASCPLCEAEQERDQLIERIDERAKRLAEASGRLKSARAALEARRAGAVQLAEAIAGLLRVAPPDGWPEEEGLQAAQETHARAAEEIKLALADPHPVAAGSDSGIDLAQIIPQLQAAAAPQESPELAAMQSLNELRSASRQLKRRRQMLQQARAEEASLKRLLEICDETIKEAVEDSLSGIEELVARYFGILMAEPLYTNIKLVYAARRSGQVEFSIDFGEHTVKPPQRIMSESQLNALGLALLLARVKASDTPWRTLVLDDVVNSFDSPHRYGLVRLLRQEFGDWQVIVLSHDSVFRDIARREAPDWEFHEIVAWTPSGGPVLGAGDPLNALADGLDRGESAAALGGHARRALESRLGKIVMKLGCRIAYDPAARYTAHDYLQALVRELKERNSEVAASDVLRRMDTASYMATRTVHTRSDRPEATSDELRRMVEDLRDLDAIFRCGGCGKPAWFAESDDGHQCGCGKLVV